MEQAEEQERGRPLPYKNTHVTSARHEECSRGENRADGSPVPDLRWDFIGDAEVVVLRIFYLIRSYVDLCHYTILSRKLHSLLGDFISVALSGLDKAIHVGASRFVTSTRQNAPIDITGSARSWQARRQC